MRCSLRPLHMDCSKCNSSLTLSNIISIIQPLSPYPLIPLIISNILLLPEPFTFRAEGEAQIQSSLNTHPYHPEFSVDT